MNTQRPILYNWILPILCLSIAFWVFSPSRQTAAIDVENKLASNNQLTKYHQKQKGIHFFGRRGIDELDLEALKENHIEWLTFVPYTGQEDYDSDQVGRRGVDYSTWTRRDSSYAQRIKTVKDHGFSVMMKPHIWMGRNESGKWRSEIDPKGGEKGWEKWANSYRIFILHYAKMSEQLGVDMFCIGTELHKPIKDHPEFWKQLAIEVRTVFSGKLTYAANWYQEVDDVSFWDELDFIGIQAYYPLCKEPNPSVQRLMKGWKPHVAQIEKLSKRYGKPILFTEIGYKSTPDAAIEPWEWIDKIDPKYKVLSHETQANCYEAFFRTFWHKEWFAGAHFWQWRTGGEHSNPDSRDQFDFTPRDKPAEKTLSKWFKLER
jgi:hypothetical protein